MCKIFKRKILARVFTVMILCTMVMSESAVTSLAANTEDTTFEFSLKLAGYTRNSNVRKKENSSPIYFYWTGTTGSSDTIKVRILGGSSTSDATVNYTYASKKSVDHVTCTRGTKYRISSLAYESKKPYVRFSLRTGGTATVSGVWSPDCAGSYTYATE